MASFYCSLCPRTPPSAPPAVATDLPARTNTSARSEHRPPSAAFSSSNPTGPWSNQADHWPGLDRRCLCECPTPGKRWRNFPGNKSLTRKIPLRIPHCCPGRARPWDLRVQRRNCSWLRGREWPSWVGSCRRQSRRSRRLLPRCWALGHCVQCAFCSWLCVLDGGWRCAGCSCCVWKR